MSEALVPVVDRREIARPGAAAVVLPEVIVDAGPAAVERFLEFFAAAIANDRTRAAYGRAAGRFLAWCGARGPGAAGDRAAPRVPTRFVQKYTVRTRPEPPVLSHFVALDRAPGRLRGSERQYLAGDQQGRKTSWGSETGTIILSGTTLVSA